MYTTNLVSTGVSFFPCTLSEAARTLTLGVVALAQTCAPSAVAVARDRVEAALERRHVGALLVAMAHLHAVLDIERRGRAAATGLDVEVDVRVDVRQLTEGRHGADGRVRAALVRRRGRIEGAVGEFRVEGL